MKDGLVKGAGSGSARCAKSTPREAAESCPRGSVWHIGRAVSSQFLGHVRPRRKLFETPSQALLLGKQVTGDPALGRRARGRSAGRCSVTATVATCVGRHRSAIGWSMGAQRKGPRRAEGCSSGESGAVHPLAVARRSPQIRQAFAANARVLESQHSAKAIVHST